jgi:hypothetical protein
MPRQPASDPDRTFIAFDAQEYWPIGDAKDVFPWEKWTLPERERILGKFEKVERELAQ